MLYLEKSFVTKILITVVHDLQPFGTSQVRKVNAYVVIIVAIVVQHFTYHSSVIIW